MRERIAVFLCEFLFFYRAENLCYQFGHGQELKPQFRKIVCLVCACFARKRINENLFRVYLLTECAYSQTEHEPQGGENMSAELDGCTVRLRHVVA